MSVEAGKSKRPMRGEGGLTGERIIEHVWRRRRGVPGMVRFRQGWGMGGSWEKH